MIGFLSRHTREIHRRNPHTHTQPSAPCAPCAPQDAQTKRRDTTQGDTTQGDTTQGDTTTSSAEMDGDRAPTLLELGEELRAYNMQQTAQAHLKVEISTAILSRACVMPSL